jgi:hypothetical protein
MKLGCSLSGQVPVADWADWSTVLEALCGTGEKKPTAPAAG